MKNKMIIGILSVALLFSVVGNIWLYRSATEAETLQEKIAAETEALQDKIAELEGGEAEQQAKVTGLESQITGYEAQISELQETLEESEKTAALSQVCYTTDRKDDEGLIQLVKDTITSAGIQIKYAEEAEQSRTKSLLESVEDACKRDDLKSAFALLNPVAAEGGAEIQYVPEGWTFLQAAGGIGGAIFHGYELEEAQMTESNMLKHFIANGTYHFDVTQLDSFEIADGSGMVFVDVNDDKFDVSYTVTFTNKENGVPYVALVGVFDNAYRVIDIVHKDDPDSAWVNQVVVQKEENKETKPDIDNSTPDVNAAGSEVIIPDDDPSRNPDILEEDPGAGDGGTTPGVIPNTDLTGDDAVWEEFIPKLPGQGDDFNSGYDPNNPDYLPGMY